MPSVVCTVMLAMDDVQRSIWCSSVLQQFGKHHGTARHSLRGLHQVGVSTHHAHREHPQRDHGREVEGGDAGTHTKRQPVGVGVHVFGDGGQSFTHHERGDAAGVFYHLWNQRETEEN